MEILKSLLEFYQKFLLEVLQESSKNYTSGTLSRIPQENYSKFSHGIYPNISSGIPPIISPEFYSGKTSKTLFKEFFSTILRDLSKNLNKNRWEKPPVSSLGISKKICTGAVFEFIWKTLHDFLRKFLQEIFKNLIENSWKYL